VFDAKFKTLFFDRQAVTDPVEKAKMRQLSRFGAFVMRSARKSIKNRPGPSAPGTPPHAHTSYQGKPKKNGKPSKRFLFRDSILFGYGKARDSVIVGPIFKAGSVRRSSKTVPQMLEEGGNSSRRSRGKVVPTRYRPRPFMAPALEREKPKFAGMFRDSVSR